ncbi:hypothetical protein SH2C18_12120 [Clostridium sediminicola]|uniref:flagellar protein FlgN n=1 Tax=Clostridium sediminicola TaxID=3114879 RepID=UPI0031F250AF
MSIFHLYSKEEKVLKNLKTLLLKEKDILVKGKWQDLTQIVEEKKEIMNELSRLENKRLEANEDDLFNELTGDIKEKSLTVRQNIKKLIIEIQQQEETNDLLTKSSLSYTKQVLNSLGVNNKSNTYGANGKIEKSLGKLNISINQSV